MHYSDVIMDAIASQITSLTSVYPTVYSDADQRKHQSSASLAFVRGIHRRPVNSPHKWPVTRKMFPFDDVIMGCNYLFIPNPQSIAYSCPIPDAGLAKSLLVMARVLLMKKWQWKSIRCPYFKDFVVHTNFNFTRCSTTCRFEMIIFRFCSVVKISDWNYFQYISVDVHNSYPHTENRESSWCQLCGHW